MDQKAPPKFPQSFDREVLVVRSEAEAGGVDSGLVVASAALTAGE
jgi:hypothetical protein